MNIVQPILKLYENKPIISNYQQAQLSPNITYNLQQPLIPYKSNNSVPQKICELFAAKVNTDRERLNNYYGKEAISEIIILIASILTYDLNIIVRHDNRIYIYDGYIYNQCLETRNLLPAIHEFCTIASCIWRNFTVSAGMVRAVLSNVEQMACEKNYPPDIYKYIVFNNGVLNLETGALLPHYTNLFITNMVRADWTNNEIHCPCFDSLINKYTGRDSVLTDRLLEALGLCLTNDIVKKIICFVGVTNSGKSTLVRFLFELLNGGSIVTMQPNEFEERFAISKIYEKSLIACMDMEAKPLNEKATALLKNISGNDVIGAEFKYSNGSTMFVSRAHIILCSNYAIQPIRTDIAFQNRLLIVPFKNSLSEDAIPLELIMKNLQYERNAIVRKLLLSYLRLRNNNYMFSGTGEGYDTYVPPVGILQTAEEGFKEFIKDKCIITGLNDDFLFTEDLHAAYRNYILHHNKTSFSNFDSFSKFASIILNLQRGRKRKERSLNPQAGYFGIRFRDGREMQKYQ